MSALSGLPPSGGSRRFDIVSSAERLRCFARNGFVVVPGVIDEAVLAVLEAEVDALMADD